MALYVAALALMVLSAQAFRFAQDTGSENTPAVVLLALGTIAALFLIERHKKAPAAFKSTLAQRPPTFTPRWLWITVGVAALLLLVETNARYTTHPEQNTLNITIHTQVLWFTGAVILMIAGAAGSMRIFASRIGRPKPPVLITLVAIILLGWALRTWRLETAIHTFVDEIVFAEVVTNDLQADFSPLLLPFSEFAAHPRLFTYAQMLGVEVLGFGRTLSALRIIAVILGTLTIPAVYLLGRALFNRRVGLLAAFLLAVFPPHIHFSRLGLVNIVDPLIGTLLFAFLVRGMRYGKSTDYILAGLFLGLTQYFYEGGRVLLPIVTVVWLAVTISQVPRVQWRGIGVTLGLGLVLALPVYLALWRADIPTFQRFDSTGLDTAYWRDLITTGDWQMLHDRIEPVVLAFVQNPDMSHHHYGGDTPLLLASVAPFFLFGAVWSLRHPRQPERLLPLLWLAGTAAGNFMLLYSGYTARYVIVFPVLMLLAALGLEYCIQFAPFTLQTSAKHALIPLVVILGLIQVSYYFGTHIDRHNAQLRSEVDRQDAIFRAAAFPPGTTACLITRLEQSQVERRYFENMRRYVADHINLCYLTRDSLTPENVIEAVGDAEHMAFFVSAYDVPAQEFLQSSLRLEGPLETSYTAVPESTRMVLYYGSWQDIDQETLVQTADPTIFEIIQQAQALPPNAQVILLLQDWLDPVLLDYYNDLAAQSAPHLDVTLLNPAALTSNRLRELLANRNSAYFILEDETALATIEAFTGVLVKEEKQPGARFVLYHLP